MPGVARSGTPRENQTNFRDGTMRGLKKGPVGTGSAGSIIGEISFYRETWGAKRGESPCG